MGTAKQGRLNKLLIRQKQSIRKIYNLRYRDHTLKYFRTNKILQVPELLEFSTLTHIQSGIQDTTPTNVTGSFVANPTIL